MCVRVCVLVFLGRRDVDPVGKELCFWFFLQGCQLGSRSFITHSHSFII